VNTFVNSSSGHWEVPVYLKYRFGPHLLKPFVEAGVAFDRTGTSGTSGCSSSSGLCGNFAPASSTFSSSQWGLGALVGRRGVAATALHPSGQVEVDGGRYEARVEVGAIDRGDPVIVRGRTDFSLIVEKLE